MFNLEFLSLIRSAEFDATLKYLAEGSSLLEIGGGTGEQALLFEQRGFQVTSIDLAESNYSKVRCFPVIDYDGVTFPIPDDSVDIVFSSNVLEHISQLNKVHEETKRVLKSDGYAVHIMPSHIWRHATTCTHYCDLALRLASETHKALPQSINLLSAFRMCIGQLKVVAATAKWGLIPPRHGERGNIWTEARYFNPRWWETHFHENNMQVIQVEPLGLFYTGHMLFGKLLSIEARKRIASMFGSACYIFVVKPIRS